jgi:hypothetical protein
MLRFSIYFNKTLYMFQAVPPPIIRSSYCTSASGIAKPCCCLQLSAKFDKYQQLYVQFELLMMGGGTA